MEQDKIQLEIEEILKEKNSRTHLKGFSYLITLGIKKLQILPQPEILYSSATLDIFFMLPPFSVSFICYSFILKSKLKLNLVVPLLDAQFSYFGERSGCNTQQLNSVLFQLDC